MKKLLSNCQGLSALLVSAILFGISAGPIRWADPTAGVFDLGYLQRPIAGASFFFFATFCAWAALQLDFPSVDGWADKNFLVEWTQLSCFQRILFTGLLYFLLLVAFLACVALVPV